jgi:phosphatidylglycerophosphatase A
MAGETIASRIAVAIATAGGLGLLRPAPGTWASVATGAAALVWLLACPEQARSGLLIAAIVATVAGLLCAPAACRAFARKDPGQVVIDEVAGVLAGLCVLPAHLLETPLATVAVTVLLFRVFDIAKPFPVTTLEALPGALGIMADDIAAGLVAGLLAGALLQ